MKPLKLLLFLVYIVPLRNNIFGESKEYSYDSSDDSELDYGRDSYGSRDLVSIDINDKYSNRKVEYRYDSYNRTHTFTTKSPYLIDTVTDGRHTLWNSADYGYEYGKQVFLGYNDQNRRIFRVYFPGDLTGRLHDYYRGDSYRDDRYGPHSYDSDYYTRDSRRYGPYRYDSYRYDRYGRDSDRYDSYRRDYYRDDYYRHDRYALDHYGRGRYGHRPYRYDRYGHRDDYSRYGRDYDGRGYRYGDHYDSHYSYGSSPYDSYYPHDTHRTHSYYNRRDYYGPYGSGYSYGSSYSYGTHYPPYDHSSHNLITLNTRNKFNTTLVKYQYNSSNDTHIFRAVWPNLFKLVKRGDKIIWEPESGHGHYPDTVYLFPGRDGRSTLRVAYPSDRALDSYRRHALGLGPDEYHPSHKYQLQLSRPPLRSRRYYERHGRFMPKAQEAKLTDKGTSTRLLSLDVGNDSDTFYYTYSDHNHIGTFTPRFDYLFKEVREAYVHSVSDYAPIWRAGDYTELCYKVIIFRPYLTLYLINGMKLVYKKMDAAWMLFDRSVDLSEKMDFNYKFIDIDINERKSTHTFEVKHDRQYTMGWESYSFFPRFDYKIKSVKAGGTLLWQATQPWNCAYQVYVSRTAFPDIASVVITMVNGERRYFSKKLNSLLMSNWSEVTHHNIHRNTGYLWR